MDSRIRHRIFIGVYFFLSGFCFAAWTSRIPTIKANFELNDAQLGSMLLLMPFSSLAGLPVSGWLVSRYNSRGPLIASLVMLAISLVVIGTAPSIFVLGIGMCLFAFHSRILGIAVNAQALSLQKQYQKRIFGSFHGLWSTGGIASVGVSTLFVAYDIAMRWHMLTICGIALVMGAIAYPHILRNDKSTTRNRLTLGKPEPLLVLLGLLVFLASICEGGMFDWNSVYFKEVVGVQLFTLGYLTFMICMALSRFGTDWFMDRIGMKATFTFSALLISAGITVSILFPSFWICLVGFCLVGLGTAAIVPMTFLLSSTVEKYSPPVTISVIATYGIVGVFVGPPLVGYLAHAFDLRIAFITFGLAGLMMIPVSRLFFRKSMKV
ncbi:MAG TPA: MFS transporter [Cyclobacteriaceae bacterium]